jgi:hypothetical protein
MRKQSIPVLLMLFLFWRGEAEAGLEGYYWTGYDNRVHEIDFESRLQSALEASHISELTALKVSPLNGNVYAIGNGHLYKVEPELSGATTVISSVAADILAFGPGGDLYGIDQSNNKLLRLDFDTGAEMEICTVYPYSHFAIGSTGHAVAFARETSWLYSVDLTTGGAIPLGYFALPSEYSDPDYWRWGELDYGPDGLLYAWCRYRDNSSGESRLYAVDTSTLTVSPTGFCLDPREATFAITPEIIPEPTTLTIIVEPNGVGIDTITPSVGPHDYAGGWVSTKAERFINCPDVYTFDHWEGDVNDPNSADTTVFMDSDKTITAVFVVDRQCGDECHPYPSGDVNKDCKVDFSDIAMVASSWLECTRPECD